MKKKSTLYKPAAHLQIQKVFLTLITFFTFSLSQAQTFTDITPGTRSWTVPCGVNSITVEVWGGGGGGGGSSAEDNGGSGGGSGGYSRKTFSVTPGSPISYVIGAGGAGGAASTAMAGNGGTTTFSGISATGGTGGTGNKGAVGTGGIGTGGDVNSPGNSGSAGTTTGGDGATAPYSGGAGGAGVTNDHGTQGNSPGGGGGGGERANGAQGSRTGGAGGAGGMRIAYDAFPVKVSSAGCTNVVLTASSVAGATIYYQGTSANGQSTLDPSTTKTVTVAGTYYFRARSAAGCWGAPAAVVVTTGSPTSTSNSRYISNVEFVGTLNPDTNNTTVYTTTGYANHTALPAKAKQIPGGVINMKVNVAGPSNSPLSTIKGWVDWNKNGFYDNPAEKIYDTSEANVRAGNVVFGFLVPTDAQPGTYTIRLRAAGNSDVTPCGSAADGETEDYSFEVIADCTAKINSVTASQQCGNGSVQLTAVGTSETTSYRWYTSEFGPEAIAGATGANYTAENLAVGSHLYYVTAVSGSCESVNRTPVRVVVKPVPDITFSQTLQNFCGSVSSVNVSSNGGKEEVTLLEEKFENTAGNPVQFENTFGGNTSASAAWQLKNSPYVPASPEYNILKPALSSGFNGGQFASMITDVRQNSNIINYFGLKNNLNSTGFTDMKLEFDLYYFSEEDLATKNYLKLQYSIDGGTTWTDLKTYLSDVGIPSRFEKQTFTLDSSFQDKTQLKFRFALFALGSADEWIADIAAIDNLRIYGNRPLSTNFTWGGDTGVIYNATCDGPVPAGGASSVCIKPSAWDLENKKEITVTATATLSNGCSAEGTMTISNNSKVWNPDAETGNWETSKWKPDAAAPTADKCVIIRKSVTIDPAIQALARNITIETGDGARGKLTVLGNLTVTDEITNTGTSADLIVKSDANLIQVNDNAVNSGPASVRRAFTWSGADRKEYNYLSSPVQGQNMKLLHGGNAAYIPYVLKLNEATNYFVNAVADDYNQRGKGFGVKEALTAYAGSGDVAANEAEFRGVPVNGTFTTPVSRTTTARGWNLIGNPYPSNLDLQALYTANSTVMLPEFRFWDNRMNNTYTQFGGAYNGYSYALYNALSNAGNPAPGGDLGKNTGTPGPVTLSAGQFRYAKVGQAFLVRAASVGNAQVTFANAQRTASQPSRGFFGKQEEVQDLYRLQLITPSGIAFTQTVIYFAKGYDDFGLEDSRHPSTTASDAFYSFAGSEKTVINGRKPFADTDVLPLGVRHFAGGSYTIKAVDRSGVFAEQQPLLLKDKELGTVTDLSLGDYTFSASSGEYTNRFEIIYRAGTVLSTETSAKPQMEVYREGQDFVVRAAGRTLSSLEVFDGSGRLMLQRTGNAKELRFSAERMPAGVYVLKASTQDGETLTKKVRK